jgi:hypothetical protein
MSVRRKFLWKNLALVIKRLPLVRRKFRRREHFDRPLLPVPDLLLPEPL